MKPIPNHRGLRYDITEAHPDGRPLRISFSRIAGGPMDNHLVKHGRASRLPPDQKVLVPWSIRYRLPDGRESWKRVGRGTPWSPAVVESSLDEAIQFLNAIPREPSELMKFLAATSQRANLLTGALIEEYLQQGCPDRRLRPREGARLVEHKRILALANRWWASKPARSVTQADLDEFMAWRQADVESRRAAGTLHASGNGLRAGELELAALSNVFAWAVRKRRIDENPFATRGAYRDSSEVCNAQERQPATDDELHALCGWMIAHGRTVSAARCLFQALTGLRRGEYLLRWDAQAGQPGWHTRGLRNNLEVDLLVVPREKGGLNPAVVIHPILAGFIQAWRAYVQRHWPETPHWFPQGSFPTRPAAIDDSGRDLLEASRALGLPVRTTHGMRAYYVTVRRSQGTSDAQISEELGHRSGAGLIARVYGQPSQIFGSRTHDWIPDQTTQTTQLLNA